MTLSMITFNFKISQDDSKNNKNRSFSICSYFTVRSVALKPYSYDFFKCLFHSLDVILRSNLHSSLPHTPRFSEKTPQQTPVTSSLNDKFNVK